MFIQLFFVAFCLAIATILQVTMSSAYPFLDGQLNFLVVVIAITLTLLPHISILAFGLLYSFGIDLLIHSSGLHMLAFLLAFVPIYGYYLKKNLVKGNLVHMIIAVVIATILYELTFFGFFVLHEPRESLEYLISYLPVLLVYHCILGIVFFPLLSGPLSLLYYQKVKLGTRPLK